MLSKTEKAAVDVQRNFVLPQEKPLVSFQVLFLIVLRSFGSGAIHETTIEIFRPRLAFLILKSLLRMYDIAMSRDAPV